MLSKVSCRASYERAAQVRNLVLSLLQACSMGEEELPLGLIESKRLVEGAPLGGVE